MSRKTDHEATVAEIDRLRKALSRVSDIEARRILAEIDRLERKLASPREAA